jgi:hypothetical protein
MTCLINYQLQNIDGKIQQLKRALYLSDGPRFIGFRFGEAR